MNRIYKISAMILLMVFLISYCQAQTTPKKPLLIVFTGVLVQEKKQEPPKNTKKKKNQTTAPVTATVKAPSKPLLMVCDSAIVNEVISQIAASGKMDIVVYNPKYAGIQRALLEKHIKQDAVDNPADEKNVYLISKALNADYALRMQGSVSSEKVDIALEIIDTHKNQKWASSAGSVIPESSGPQAQTLRKSAVFNASSVAVSQILILAFGQKEMMNTDVAVSTPTVVAPTTETPPTRDIKAEADRLIKQADSAIEKKDVPGAIYATRLAINLQPENVDLRIKLAELYLSIKLTNKAIDEYKSAALFNKNDERIYKQLIAIYMKDGKFTDAAIYLEDILRIDPKNVDALLNLGDIYWNQSKINEAEKAYVDASNIAPDNSSVHDKLYKLYFAKNEFGKAFPEKYLSKEIIISDKSEDGKYAVISQMIKDEYADIVNRLNTSREDFDKQTITREEYYQECKLAGKEIDAFSEFSMKQKASTKAMNAHSHALLAINLLSQECGSLVSYFETEKSHYLDQANVYSSEAKTEMDLYNTELAKL